LRGGGKTVGVKKFPILDEDFLDRCLEACESDEERGLFLTYTFTGMRASEATKLTRDDLRTDGHRWIIVWVDQSSGRRLNAEVPNEHAEAVAKFLSKRRRGRITYHYKIRDIGERAGYEDISPETLRITYCARLLQEGHTPAEIQSKMRCSAEIVARSEGALMMALSMRRSETETHESRMKNASPNRIASVENWEPQRVERLRAAPVSTGSRGRRKGHSRKKGAPKENIVKQRFLRLYGGKCVCCGEESEAFLTLDHVHDDGKDHKAMFKGSGQMAMKDAVSNPDFNRYQILCANCQMAKKNRMYPCPHKAKRSKRAK
jgi:hypothetical protein